MLQFRYLSAASSMAELQPSPAQAIDFLTLLHNLKVKLCSIYKKVHTLHPTLDMHCL